MPATKKQIKQGRLKARAENEEETPMRRIRAAKSLLLLSNFTRDPSRIARRTANLFITSGEVSEDVRAAAAKLLELVSSHAVNENAEQDSDDEMPTQFQIQRPKKLKPKFSLEAIRAGDDLVAHFWEVLAVGDAGFPATESDFHTAKIRARQTLLESGRLATRTEREEVLEEFRELVRKILMDSSFRNLARTCNLCAHGGHRLERDCREYQMDPASAALVMQQAESATPIASPTDYGVPVSLTRDQIVPRPDLSVPPTPEPGQVYARGTCSVCKAGGFALIHDCLMFQQGNS